MTLPNKLTISRLFLTAAFLAVFFAEFRFSATWALVFFSLGGVTDWLDGWLARRAGTITAFGALMDPLADKILICSGFIALVERDLVPAWMAVIIVGREFAITGLRLLAASKQIVLSAEGYGKHKTIWQNVAIIALLVSIAHHEWGNWGAIVFGAWVNDFAKLAKWAAVILTVISGAVYLTRNREIYLRDC